MTELEPYQPTYMTRVDMRNQATDSWTDVLEQIGDLASRVNDTDFVPANFRQNGPAVAAAILYGREIGLSPMTALQSLHNIKGKVGLAAEGMRALVLQNGHEIVTTESTGAKCTMKAKRKNSDEWTTVTWTLDDARRANLLATNKNWQTYPRQMLQARTSTELCRLVFPDVIRGLASVEELEALEVGGAVAGDGESTPVKRATRKRAAATKPEPAERPAPPLPDDGAEDGTESGVPSAGEASDEQPGSVPPLPGETPQTGGDEQVAQEETPDTGGVAGSSPARVSSSSPLTGGSGKTTGKGTPPEPDPALLEPPTPDEDGVYDAEVIEDEVEAGPRVTPKQRNLLLLKFNTLGIEDREERIFIANLLVGREIDSFNDLTLKEAGRLIDTLAPCETPEQLQAVVTLTAEHAEKGGV